MNFFYFVLSFLALTLVWLFFFVFFSVKKCFDSDLMWLFLYFLNFGFLMEGIVMILKMENVFNIGIDVLKRLSMFVIREVIYFLSSLFIFIKWCLVGVRLIFDSLLLGLKFFCSCLIGRALLEMVWSFCLACLIVGLMWLKFILFFWNVLFSWFNMGSICWKM